MSASHPADEPPVRTGDPVFIRGTGRCASTMLVNQLGLHPELAQVPRDEVLPEELLDWSRFRLSGEHERSTHERSTADAAETIGPVAGAACRAYFDAWCRATAGGDGLPVHKGTMKVHLTDALLEHWPGARLVYLVRHPLGVVPSLVNADIHLFKGRFGYRATVANSLLRWYNDLAAFVRSAAFGHPRVLMVRYESLIADPDATLAEIHSFIGVEPRPYEPQQGRQRYDRPFRLSARERRFITESTAGLVRQLGCDTDATAPQTPEAAAEDASYPERRLRAVPPALDGLELAQLALARARDAGHRRVGLFGAGYLARLVCPRMHGPETGAPPLSPLCLLDDDPLLRGATIGGLRVVRPEDAAADLDAVIPLTLVHQQLMIERWRRRFPAGPPALPLWNEWSNGDTAAASDGGRAPSLETVEP